MKILNCVLCGVIEDNKLLMIYRNKEPYKNHWTLPGGKMEYSEHVDEAAVREMKEETNLDCNFEKICGIANEILHEKGKAIGHFVMFVCKLKAKHNDIIESDEGKLEWVDIKDLPKLKIVPSDYEMIKQYLLKDKEVKVHRIKTTQDGETYDMEEFL